MFLRLFLKNFFQLVGLTSGIFMGGFVLTLALFYLGAWILIPIFVIAIAYFATLSTQKDIEIKKGKNTDS